MPGIVFSGYDHVNTVVIVTWGQFITVIYAKDVSLKVQPPSSFIIEQADQAFVYMFHCCLPFRGWMLWLVLKLV